MDVNPMYLTVSALTKYIKVKLENDKHLTRILIKGELSNFKRHSRGHFYFTLKDEQAAISCIMFQRDTLDVQFDPKEGDHVLIEGRISLYEPSGSYSIQVRSLKLDGIGELYLKYEKLKKELEEKGYFKEEHKQAIPKFPKKIGVITSPTGAVIQDITNTINRRYRLCEIHLYPALVQGPGSSESIRKQITYANELNEVDVLIVGRGGGSIEDLWGFNELNTIEAIYQSKIPIITAIGHETDYTLSDFVGDLRAPTPTAAAELATPNEKDLLEKIDDYRYQIQKLTMGYIEFYQTKLMHLESTLEKVSPKAKLDQFRVDLTRLDDLREYYMKQLISDKKMSVLRNTERLKHPQEKIDYYKEKMSVFNKDLNQHMMFVLHQKQNHFELMRQALKTLSPLALMDKGYAIIKKDQKVLTNFDQVQIKDEIEIELKDGYVYTEVKRKKEK